jgi:membrane protease YdiL (CAAX protease family)
VSTPPPPGQPAWSAADTLLGIALTVAILITGSIPVVVIAGDSGLDLALGSQLVLELAFLGAAFYFAARNGVGIGEGARLLGLRRPQRPWVKTTILAFLAYIGVSLIYGLLVAPEQRDLADELGFNVNVFGAIASGLLIVIAAPIAEEVFFRGFFFAGLRRSLPFWAAALISGSLFGVIHLSTGNFAVAGQLAIFGIVLAWLYEEHHSLVPPISLHLLNNAIAFSFLVGG